MSVPPREKATAEFADASVEELAEWLRKECGLQVIVHAETIAKECYIAPAPADGADFTVPSPYNRERPFDGGGKAIKRVLRFTNRLDDAPLYLLLDRLEEWDLGWWYEDEILHLSSNNDRSRPMVTKTYPVDDLLNAEMDSPRLAEKIAYVVEPDTWGASGGGWGEIRGIGGFLAVTQSEAVHCRIAALLQGLRTRGRRTWVSEPAGHVELRKKIDLPVTVNFDGVPLTEAIASLGSQVGARIDLDREALRALAISEQTPIHAQLTDRPLRAVLKVMLREHELYCQPRNGVLYITTEGQSYKYLALAVYDVRDLCQDVHDFDSLIDSTLCLISVHSDTGCWHMGQGGCESKILPVPPGAIVVLNEERAQDRFLEVLEAYRETLRNHPPRIRPNDEPTTVYYRLERDMAEQLAPVLPELAAPDSWGEETSIHCVASGPLNPGTQAPGNHPPCSVLIVRQTQAVHGEIREVLRRVAGGDYHAKNYGLSQGIGSSYAVEPEAASP